MLAALRAHPQRTDSAQLASLVISADDLAGETNWPRFQAPAEPGGAGAGSAGTAAASDARMADAPPAAALEQCHLDHRGALWARRAAARRQWEQSGRGSGSGDGDGVGEGGGGTERAQEGLEGLAQHQRALVFMFGDLGYMGRAEKWLGDPGVIIVGSSMPQQHYRIGQDVSFPVMPVLSPSRSVPVEATAAAAASASAPGAGTMAARARPLLLSFRGKNSHPVRAELAKLHNGGDVVVEVLPTRTYGGVGQADVLSPSGQAAGYLDVLASSVFGLAPRGDSHFSYRLPEIMAAGGIPVILSDGWVLPFSEALDWSAFSVRVEEADASGTLALLRSIPPERVRAMQRKVAQVYRDHFASFERQADTLLGIVARQMECSA
jgi:hypothetical protein